MSLELILLLIPLLPLGAAVIAGLLRNQIGRAGAHWVAILGVAFSFALSVWVLYQQLFAGLGTQNLTNLRILREMITEVPLIVDAGVGTASDAAIAMELGYEGVLMNTAIAAAEDSTAMATAMRLAVEAGRYAYLAGRMPKKLYASASSPLAGVVGSS